MDVVQLLSDRCSTRSAVFFSTPPTDHAAGCAAPLAWRESVEKSSEGSVLAGDFVGRTDSNYGIVWTRHI